MEFRSFWFLMLATVTLFWGGCKGEVDVEAPVAEVVSFSPQPASGFICGEEAENVFYLLGGQTLEFDIIFRDNEGLSQYKIDIHSNFDCHGHARGTEDWSLLEVIDLSGTEQAVSRSLEVPDDVTAGAYHFQVQVIDLAGNEDPLANYYDLRILNMVDTLAPQLSVTAPDEASFGISRGESLNFTGSVRDNYSLGEGGNGRLLLTYQGTNSGNLFEAEEILWPETQGDRAGFDFSYEIPQTFTTGTYEFVLSAYDGVNNESNRARFTVEVGE